MKKQINTKKQTNATAKKVVKVSRTKTNKKVEAVKVTAKAVKQVAPSTIVPAPVVGSNTKKMPDVIHQLILAKINAKGTSSKTKALFESALKIKPYRFISMPDEVRQAVCQSALHSLAESGQLNLTARIYDISAANLKKWRDEKEQGLTIIRKRGRPLGQKNEYRHIIHEGKEVRVPVSDTEAKRVVKNNVPRTEYVLKRGVTVA